MQEVGSENPAGCRPKAMEADKSISNIGTRVRRLREAQGLSLRQVAQRAGLSTSAVQKTEAGTMTPTIGVLMKIARGLKCRVIDFLEEDGQRGEVVLTRRRQRRRVTWGRGKITVETMAGEPTIPEIVVFELHLAGGADSGLDLLSHRGEEIALCVKGKIRFEIEGKPFDLRPGDCLHFKSHLPHRWSNPGPKAARILLVCTAAGNRSLPWQ